MGFLRKVGRKIKKKVNKLFGSKFGKIIGGIGLSMMFFGGAKALFGKEGWWKNFSERIKDGNLFGRNNVADAAKEAVNVLEVNPDDPLSAISNVADVADKSKNNILSSFKESEFIPDVLKGAGTSLAISAVQGEPEEPFISGGIAPQPAMEASQNAYLAEVQNQMPQYQGTNFQNLNQSLFYGTLSPDYLLTQTRMG
tara:strand:- start:47 stop:637 length:591 start_codon:yes stop_codon:yes gene_type:complete